MDLSMDRSARRAARQEHLSSQSIDNLQRVSAPSTSKKGTSQYGSEASVSTRVKSQMPSGKVQKLADHIIELEDKCQYLESRNSWLTKQLLSDHKTRIEGALLGHSQLTTQIVFHAWHERLHELSLEKQLGEQTDHLDKCQQVTRDLGMILAQEQDGRKAAAMSHQCVKEDLHRAVAHERYLAELHQQNAEKIELMEKWLKEAEVTLGRCCAQAKTVIDVAGVHEERPRSFANELRLQRNVQNDGATVEQRIKLRAEAHKFIREAQGLLKQGVSQPPESAP